MLLSHCLAGNLETISIFLLHSNMDKEYVEALVKSRQDIIKVVLATDIIESLPLSLTFAYIIDTVCQRRIIYDSRTYSNEDIYEWVAKDCLLRRESIISIQVETVPQIFRLISEDSYNRLQTLSTPCLVTMPLDKICLTAKLLSPSTMISEYLSLAIVPPPLVNVHQTVQLLKKIDVLDETEEITWMGCRLLDLPLPCQLGRTLVFGILLQCLDPVLTIVSALSITDPLGVPFKDDIDHIWNNFTTCIQKRIISERYRFGEDQQSDHFIFIRLFHEWQCRFKNNLPSLYLTDEYDFVLNGLMEQLNATRSRLLNALQSSNLVHGNGQLSMQNINRKSNSWPSVKAALTGGMYPDIYVADAQMNCIRSAYSIKVPLHPNTVLRKSMEPFGCYANKLKTSWVVLTKHMNRRTYATVTIPLAVILLAGSRKFQYGLLTEEQTPFDDNTINFFIDEWIWMVMPKSFVELIVKTRQFFFLVYNKLLQHCTDSGKWSSQLPGTKHYQMLADTLTNIFENEDLAAGFNRTIDILNSPISMQPNLYLLMVNSQFNYDQDCAVNVPHERLFFLLYTDKCPNEFYQRTSKLYIEDVLGKFIRPIEKPERHIFIILYGKRPDIMYSVSRAKTLKGEIVFKEYFRNTIPICEVLEACATLKVSIPSFEGRLITSLIDKKIGNVIMNLFAFRNHWIHKKYVQNQT